MRTKPAGQSARSLRAKYRAAERSEAQRRLLIGAGTALASEKSPAAAIAAILAQASAFAAADVGSVLAYETGALSVVAAVGPTSPVGTNLAAVGALASVLRAPAAPLLRTAVDSQLRVGRERAVRFEALFPLARAGEGCGVLALASVRAPLELDAEDLRTLEAVAGIVAAALHSRANAQGRPKPHDPEVLGVLTPRERQVLALLPRGMTNAAMAEELGIAAGTIKVHVERILAKLRLTDRTQAAVLAAQHGYAP